MGAVPNAQLSGAGQLPGPLRDPQEARDITQKSIQTALRELTLYVSKG